jgi:hypothetical protein
LLAGLCISLYSCDKVTFPSFLSSAFFFSSQYLRLFSKSSRRCVLLPTWFASVAYHSMVSQKSNFFSEYDQSNWLSYVGYYERKVKISRSRLSETRDKHLLERESDRNWCHRHTRMSMIKLYGRSPWLHGHWRQHTGKVKRYR